MDVQEKTQLIDEKFTRPSFLIWVMLLPQLVLLLINFSCWTLVRGDVTTEQAMMWARMFSAEGMMLVVGLLVFIFFVAAKRNIGIFLCLFLFLLHIGYLWLITSYVGYMIPDTANLWILTVGSLCYYQYTFMMPMVFYTGLRLACIPRRTTKTVDMVSSGVVALAVPLVGYIVLNVIVAIEHNVDISESLMVVFFIASTVILMFAVLRLLTNIYLLLRNSDNGQLALAIVVGLVLPIAGLALNSTIPFPVDFQSVGVYIMAVINGLILLAAFKKGSKLYNLAWCGRCVMYPFTLYFFLVFLPFMPLSLPAIIAVGSGFLILTPTVLFLIHTRKIVDEGREIAAVHGLPKVILVFIIAFAVIPSVMVADAYRDKAALTNAIDAAYNPDYTASADIDPKVIEHTLLKLKDMKEGIFLPFISPVYNKIVFNGMVLPDHKIKEMYKMFVGMEMPKKEQEETFGFMARPRTNTWQGIRMPERNVDISDIKTHSVRDGEFVKTTVQLTLTNKGPANSEFVTEIEPGEGVMVCGYRLRMEGKDVEGLVFEKKAAMWVYHMIRDLTNRDPGLLVYRSDNVLKLSVFPLAEGEERITAIDFLYPSAASADINIGSRTIRLNPAEASSKGLSVADGQAGKFLVLPRRQLADLPAVRRKPYLHFIVDRSFYANKKFDSFASIMTDVASGAQIDECRITLANFRSYDITGGIVSTDQIESIIKTIDSQRIKFEGGLCHEKAIMGELLKYKEAAGEYLSSALRVPVFVVIMNGASKTVSAADMTAFAKITPDLSCYYIAKSKGSLDKVSFNDKTLSSSASIEMPAEVVLFNAGGSLTPCLKNSDMVFVYVADAAAGPQVYRPDNGSFVDCGDLLDIGSDSDYAKGLSLWHKYRRTAYSPYTIDEKTPELVKESKATGILMPYTSYIVLENSAQLEILKRKERQRLNSNNALEFDEFMESPAPSALLLLPFAAAMLFIKKRPAK